MKQNETERNGKRRFLRIVRAVAVSFLWLFSETEQYCIEQYWKRFLTRAVHVYTSCYTKCALLPKSHKLNLLATHLKSGLQYVIINPRRACAAMVTVLGLSVLPSVRPSLWYHLFCHYAQQGRQKAIPMGSAPYWFDV